MILSSLILESLKANRSNRKPGGDRSNLAFRDHHWSHDHWPHCMGQVAQGRKFSFGPASWPSLLTQISRKSIRFLLCHVYINYGPATCSPSQKTSWPHLEHECRITHGLYDWKQEKQTHKKPPKNMEKTNNRENTQKRSTSKNRKNTTTKCYIPFLLLKFKACDDDLERTSYSKGQAMERRSLLGRDLDPQPLGLTGMFGQNKAEVWLWYYWMYYGYRSM